MRRVIEGLSDRLKEVPKMLEPLVGAELYLAISSENNAKVLSSSVVALLNLCRSNQGGFLLGA